MYSVKYDSTELVNSTYHLQYAKDQSAPPREFTLVPYASEDGAIIVYDRYGVKHIIVKGFISAATPAALQIAVDSFKELFSRRNKNLDITPDGGVLRRYVANCASHTLTGDYYNLTFLPYEADFIVVEGVGKATANTSIINQTLTTDYDDSSVLSIGSAPEQKARFTFIFTTPAAMTGIKIRTYSTTYDFDTAIIVTATCGCAFGASKSLEIDCNAKTVKYDGTAINYYGTFPRAVIGSSGINIAIDFAQIRIEYNRGGILNSDDEIFGADWIAQSFMVKHTDSSYRSLSLYLNKEGAPPNNLVVTIEGDNGGVPDGVAVATFNITAASITAPNFYTNDAAADFSLTGNTKYWIVAKTTAGDTDNNYRVYKYTSNNYSKGNYATSDDSGTTWANDFDKDMDFTLYFGGKLSGAISVPTIIDYLPRYL